MVKWIAVLVVEPGKAPDVCELPNNLKAFELTIRGYIETVETVRSDCLIVCNGNYDLPKNLSREQILKEHLLLSEWTIQSRYY